MIYGPSFVPGSCDDVELVEGLVAIAIRPDGRRVYPYRVFPSSGSSWNAGLSMKYNAPHLVCLEHLSPAAMADVVDYWNDGRVDGFSLEHWEALAGPISDLEDCLNVTQLPEDDK